MRLVRKSRGNWQNQGFPTLKPCHLCTDLELEGVVGTVRKLRSCSCGLKKSGQKYIFSPRKIMLKKKNREIFFRNFEKCRIFARRAIVFARYRLGQGKWCVNRVCPSVRLSCWCRQIAQKCGFWHFGMHISGGKITTRVQLQKPNCAQFGFWEFGTIQVFKFQTICRII